MRKYAYKIRLIIAGIILVLAVLAIYGIYPVKIMDLQFTPLLERALLTTAYASIALLLIVILFTIAFGRFYCSTICPFGILQEFSALLFRRKKENKKVKNFPIKHFICALTIGALFSGSAILIRYIDPYSLFGSTISFTVTGLIFTLCILILVFFKNRYFCTNICPVGAFLGNCSKMAVNTINIDTEKCISCRMCERNCQAGCINIENKSVDNEMCVKCLKCLSICPKSAIYFGKRKQVFSPVRRKALICTTMAVFLASGYFAGIKFTKNIAKKVKNVIFPAGSKDANRMANKCLNCNLCVANCPNGIISKADNSFSTVHIDYTKGEKYCQYDCHKCADVCPSNAIKRISLEEKQNTRIAMAEIKADKCIKCGHCVFACPKQAIDRNDEQPAVIDGSKCIGCAKCSRVCPVDAIEMHGIKEQTTIS